MKKFVKLIFVQLNKRLLTRLILLLVQVNCKIFTNDKKINSSAVKSLQQFLVIIIYKLLQKNIFTKFLLIFTIITQFN